MTAKLQLRQAKIRAKILVKKLLNTLGYQVSRYHQHRPGSKKLVKTEVGNFNILLYESHQLPVYMHNPAYSTNLPRLAAAVKEKYGELSMIDVGANMGDTVALVRSKSYFPIASIEGDGEFFQILKENMKNFKDVSIFPYVMGDEDKEIFASYKKSQGSEETARITSLISSTDKKRIKIITLDTFLIQNPKFKSSKLLKIDTDGYDLKIIKGGMGYIKETKPVIFFEYDPVFFEEEGDDTLSTLGKLKELRYKDVIFYDNQGKFILSTTLCNKLLLKQMHNLIDRNYRTPFPFYDMVLFHEEDGDIANKFVESEMSYFYGA